MRFMRSTWLIRCVALLLVGAMVPPLFSTANAGTSNRPAAWFADWIRAQALVPDDPAVEKALEEVAAGGAQTFERFVESFVGAYEQLQPATPAARVFTERDLTSEALIDYLQRRYTELSPEAVLPRLRFTAAPPAAALTLLGHAAFLSSAADGPVRVSAHPYASPQVGDHVVSLSTITPANPQGP